MTSAHKLIAIALIWIVCGGVMTVLFMSAGVTFVSGGLLVVISLLILASALAATYLVTRSVPDQKSF